MWLLHSFFFFKYSQNDLLFLIVHNLISFSVDFLIYLYWFDLFCNFSREAQYEHNLSIENPYSTIGNNENTMSDYTGYIEVVDDNYHELSSIGDPETKYGDTINKMYLTVTT